MEDCNFLEFLATCHQTNNVQGICYENFSWKVNISSTRKLRQKQSMKLHENEASSCRQPSLSQHRSSLIETIPKLTTARALKLPIFLEVFLFVLGVRLYESY